MPTLLLLAATAIWGSTFVVVQDAVEQMAVHPFLAWRFSIAAILMILIRPRAMFALPVQQRKRGILLGLVLAIGYFTQTQGLALGVAPSVSGFITGMFVVFTPLFSALLLRHRLSGATWIAVALSVTGLAALSLRGWSIGLGELLTLACAAAFALQILGLARWSEPGQAYGLTLWQLSTVAVIEIVITGATGSFEFPPTQQVWIAVLFLALFATAFGFIAQTWAQAHMPATRAAVILTTEPVWAGAVGVATGDPVTARLILGGALILAAMYVVELTPRRRDKPDVITETVH